MRVNAKSKINLAFGAIGVLFMLFAFVLLNQATRIKWHSNEIETNWLPGIVSINTIDSAMGEYRAAEIGHSLAKEDISKVEFNQKMVLLKEKVQAMKDKYEPTIRPTSEIERALYQHFIKLYDQYMVASEQVITLSKNYEQEKAIKQITDNNGIYNDLLGYLQELVELNARGGETEGQNGKNVFEFTKVQIIVGVSIISLALIIGFTLSGGLHKHQDSEASSRIKRNTFLAILFLILLCAVYSGLIYQQLVKVDKQTQELSNKWLPSLVVISDIRNKAINYRVTEFLTILALSPDEKIQLKGTRKVLFEEISNSLKKYSPMISSDYERNIFEQFSQSYDEYTLISKKIAGFADINETDKALSESNQSVILYDDFINLLGDLLRFNERGGVTTSFRNNAVLDSIKVISLGGVAFILLSLIILAKLTQSWILDARQDRTFESDAGATLTIKLKLRLVFFGMLLAFILFSMMINGLMQVLNNNSHEIEDNWLPSIIKVNEINKMVSDYRVAVTRHIFATNAEEKSVWDKTRMRLSNKIAFAKINFEKSITSDYENNLYQDFSHYYTEYLKKSEVLLALSTRNETAAALNALQANRINFDSMTINLNNLVRLNAEGGENAAQINNQVFDVTEQIIYAIVLTILLITILFMIIFDKNISLALERLTITVRSLAAGVLVSTNDDLKNRQDEIGQMANAVDMVNKTLEALKSDANELIHAAEAGMLSVRVDDDRHPGEFKTIVAGMNTLIDVLSKPLGDIAEIMQNLALGDLSGRMEGNYEGELYILKTNVNRSLEALVSLLTELSQTMQYMANNDLSHQLTGNYQGEFSLLKASTNQTIGHMIEILQEITISTSQSAVAIAQTSESSKYVADEASQQMFAIENVSKTIDETAESVGEIAQKAQEGSQLALSTANCANEGQAQLNKLNDLIQLTDDITRIADKTHLLSLNAGLEAMRAGEYGLGFGLVAQQIGTLAEEVTVSAQKIRLGVHTLQDTQAAMKQIAQAAQVSEVNVQSISVAIVQQSSAVKTITERVNELRISSGATASAAEEISSTMNHLAQTVKETADKVKRFKLTES